jgi:pyridoxal 5'-phosphate synthase pdxT subunit
VISSLSIGVLALQGSYDAHLQSLKQLSVDARLIHQVEHLASIDALIIPGGESTTMLELLKKKRLLLGRIAAICS